MRRIRIVVEQGRQIWWICTRNLVEFFGALWSLVSDVEILWKYIWYIKQFKQQAQVEVLLLSVSGNHPPKKVNGKDLQQYMCRPQLTKLDYQVFFCPFDVKCYQVTRCSITLGSCGYYLPWILLFSWCFHDQWICLDQSPNDIPDSHPAVACCREGV